MRYLIITKAKEVSQTDTLTSKIKECWEDGILSIIDMDTQRYAKDLDPHGDGYVWDGIEEINDYLKE